MLWVGSLYTDGGEGIAVVFQMAHDGFCNPGIVVQRDAVGNAEAVVLRGQRSRPQKTA